MKEFETPLEEKPRNYRGKAHVKYMANVLNKCIE